jgi:hypothetical protein
MKSLYRRLKSDLGLDRAFVRSAILPEWWEDEVASNPVAYSEALMFVARHAGVDMKSLRDPSQPLSVRLPSGPRYKRKSGTELHELAVASAIATRVAATVALGIPGAPSAVPSGADEIREAILDTGADWVGLDELVDYCWNHGIPVVHVSLWPRGVKRPYGLIAMVDGRPVIVLCKNQKSPAWLLFLLAHELGHLCLGHLDPSGVFLDEHFNEDSPDAEEQQADRFAVELLTGHPDFRVIARDRWPSARLLAVYADQEGRKEGISPGHLILNYSHSMGGSTGAFFAVANAALKIIEKSTDGRRIIADKMASAMEWSELPEDAADFVMKMTTPE